MNQWYPKTVYENEEDRQLARILSTLIWASWGGSLFGIILGLFYNDWKLTAVTLAGCALLSVPLILLRRRYLHASGMFLMLIMLGTTTFIATIGQGIRDLAVFGFLIVIIFAGLALNHTYFRLCVGLSLVAVCWLFFGESFGWFATTPFEGGVTNWFYLVGMTIIFLITALAVDFLTTNMRKSLELARQEISQRKQMEEEVKNSERRFHALVEHGRDNISLLAADGTLLWENPSANHILGYAPDQFRGHNIFELMHPDDQAWTRDMYAQVLQSPGAIRDGVFRLLHADRTWRWIECSATNLLDEPSVQAIVLNYRDITARKRVEKEKNIYAEELEILYQLATELSDLPAETDLAAFTARKIKELTHSFAVTFSEYNPQKKQLENGKLITDSAIISRVNAVLGKKVDSLVYPVSDEMYLEIKQNRIGFKKNLSEASFGTIPDMAGSILQKMFNLDNFIGLVVLDNDKLLGTIMLILQKGETIPSERFLTSLTYLIAIAFKRKRAEEALQESESRYRQAITAAGAVPYYRDYQKETHAYTFMGEGILQLTGYSAGEITPDIFDQQEQECIMRGSLAHLTPDEAGQMSEAGKIQQWICDYRILTRDGQTRWVADSAIQIRDENNQRVGVIGILQDITERKLAEEQLRYQSTHDILTGIYNRVFFETELARLEHSREFPVSIIMADVDKLKVANDTQGHAVGDELLCHAADVMRTVFREGDMLARIGGDEFAVLLPATNAATAEQMLVRVEEQLVKHNTEHPDLPPVQLSLGTATAEKNNLTEAFTLADRRMYADKAERKAKAKTEVHDADTN